MSHKTSINHGAFEEMIKVAMANNPGLSEYFILRQALKLGLEALQDPERKLEIVPPVKKEKVYVKKTVPEIHYPYVERQDIADRIREIVEATNADKHIKDKYYLHNKHEAQKKTRSNRRKIDKILNKDK